MLWFRVDNRLVHGQVIEGWLPYVAARHLIVANDAMSADLLQQQIVSLAVPEQVAIHFVPVRFMLPQMEAEGRYRVAIAVGCTGGRHRSVATAEALFQMLRQADYPASIEHRHLELG